MSFTEMARPYVCDWGWAVFPVSRNKVPCIKGGCHAATTDLSQIEAWSSRFPHANVAVATGAVNGIVVLDVDHPNGIASLNRFFELGFDPLPNTITARTGGGGMHYYFLITPENLKNRAGHIAPGLDIRSDGGSIIAPPSIHASGKPYGWLRSPDYFCDDGIVMPAPMPEWLRFKAVQEPWQLKQRCYKPLSGRAGTQGAILEDEERTLRAAQSGTRNDALNRAAFVFGQFVAGGAIGEQEARARLSHAAQSIGLDTVEINSTVQSGLTAGFASPRR